MATWIDNLTTEQKMKMYDRQEQEEHELNKQAIEMLQYYLNEVNPVLEHSQLPILELMERMLGLETSPLLDKWIQLAEIPEEKMIQMIDETEMMPELTQKELENLSQDPSVRFQMKLPIPKWVTQVEWTHQDLRRDLRYVLEAVDLPPRIECSNTHTTCQSPNA